MQMPTATNLSPVMSRPTPRLLQPSAFSSKILARCPTPRKTKKRSEKVQEQRVCMRSARGDFHVLSIFHRIICYQENSSSSVRTPPLKLSWLSMHACFIDHPCTKYVYVLDAFLSVGEAMRRLQATRHMLRGCWYLS
jgi:hypothetical protein